MLDLKYKKLRVVEQAIDDACVKTGPLDIEVYKKAIPSTTDTKHPLKDLVLKDLLHSESRIYISMASEKYRDLHITYRDSDNKEKTLIIKQGKGIISNE